MAVYRKDSKKLPIGDPELDWEETVYLNLIIHQFEYILTLAICTRTSPKQLQILRRISQVCYFQKYFPFLFICPFQFGLHIFDLF